MTKIQELLLAELRELMIAHVNISASIERINKEVAVLEGERSLLWDKARPLGAYLALCKEAANDLASLQEHLTELCSSKGIILNFGELPRAHRSDDY